MQNYAARYRRIYWVARVLRWLIVGSMLAIIVLAVFPLISPRAEWLVLPHVIAKIDQSTISTADFRLAVWLSLLSKGVLFYGFYRLAAMMRACERGDLFSPQVPTHLLWFSTTIVVVELLHISLPLQIAAAHLMSGQAQGQIDLVIRSEQLFLLQLAVLFMILAAMLREAASIAEDNARII